MRGGYTLDYSFGAGDGLHSSGSAVIAKIARGDGIT